MPSPYNVTSINATDFMVLAVDLDSKVSGLLGLGLLILIGAVLFFSMKEWEIKKAMASSLFITSIIGVFMFVGGLLQIQYLIVVIVLTGLAAVSLLFD